MHPKFIHKCSSFVLFLGVLVQAMRKGEWIILDELNLAPSEVLEALNRLLDDNRQLFITETGITVTAHPRFMLFATQNPPGLYGGRKVHTVHNILLRDKSRQFLNAHDYINLFYSISFRYFPEHSGIVSWNYILTRSHHWN